MSVSPALPEISQLRPQVHAFCKELHLPTVRACLDATCQQAAREGWSYDQFLAMLLQRECEARYNGRLERLRRESRLPPDKSLSSFDLKRLPPRVVQQVTTLREGSFLARRENVLAFGNPGSGKTHLLCGLCHELIQQGHRVLYASCSLLVQELLVAKRDLTLHRVLKRLGRYEALLLDDLGYVQQSREEMEVLFTLLAERYERGSVLITSNLPFSKWENIFKDPMTTAAAIDRLVHHSVILELNLPSYRMEQAQSQQQAAEIAPS
jgi:DNA replication protein DnaC